MQTTLESDMENEFCLRTYGFNEGPDYPKGRKHGETVGEFVRRLQIAELRNGAKNIFASVPMKYTFAR